MATAQQTYVDALATIINVEPNMSARVVASSPSPGVLRVTSKNTDTPILRFLPGRSTVTGAGTFVNTVATGSPPYVDLKFSWTLAPGDVVTINVGTPAQTLDLGYTLGATSAVDPGGFDHTTVTGGGTGVAIGGTGFGSARHRRLVVMECGSASTSFGSLFALDPADATGVAIPTFRVTRSLPTAGSSAGESVYVTATRQGYVWDGTAWRDITASPIRAFANDAALQANTTEAVGAYAVSSDTGNMYVRTADGWRRIGVAEFATYADLIAWDGAIGTQAICRDLDVMFLRVEQAGGTKEWIPISELVKPEAEILAAPNAAGLTAVAIDTGKRFVNNGARWVQDPIEHYPTEADLLATTPISGHLAWADDTGIVFVAANNAWKRIAGPQISVGATEPTTNATGDLWFLPAGDERGLKIWDGTDANTANHGWRDADRNPILYVGAGAFNAAQINKAGNWGMPTGTVPDPKQYMPQANDQYLNVNTGLYIRLTGPAPGGAGGAMPAAPVDSGITGSATIGSMSVGPTYQRVDSDSYTVSEKVIALSKNCTQWFEMWGMVQCGVDYRAEPVLYFNGTRWDNFSTTGNLHPQAMCCYISNGVSVNNDNYFTDHGAGFVFRSQPSYAARANFPLMFTLKGTKLGGSYWLLDLTAKIHSDNDTPMLMTASWQITNTNAITSVGVKTAVWNSTTAQNGPYSFQVRYV